MVKLEGSKIWKIVKDGSFAYGITMWLFSSMCEDSICSRQLEESHDIPRHKEKLVKKINKCKLFSQISFFRASGKNVQDVTMTQIWEAQLIFMLGKR